MEEEEENFLERTTPEAVLDLMKLDGTFDKLRKMLCTQLEESGEAEKLREETKKFLEDSGVLASVARGGVNNKATTRGTLAELLKEVDRKEIPKKIERKLDKALDKLQEPLHEKVAKALADLKEVGQKRALPLPPPSNTDAQNSNSSSTPSKMSDEAPLTKPSTQMHGKAKDERVSPVKVESKLPAQPTVGLEKMDNKAAAIAGNCETIAVPTNVSSVKPLETARASQGNTDNNKQEPEHLQQQRKTNDNTTKLPSEQAEQKKEENAKGQQQEKGTEKKTTAKRKIISSSSSSSSSSSDSSSSDSDSLSDLSSSDSSSDSDSLSDLSSDSDSSSDSSDSKAKTKKRKRNAKGDKPKTGPNRKKRKEGTNTTSGVRSGERKKKGGERFNGGRGTRQVKKRKLEDVKEEANCMKREVAGEKKTTIAQVKVKKEKDNNADDKETRGRNGFHNEEVKEQTNEGTKIVNCKNGGGRKGKKKREEEGGEGEGHVNSEKETMEAGDSIDENGKGIDGRKGLRLSLSSRRKRRKAEGRAAGED